LKRKVLIVDDIPEVIEFLTDALGAEYDVEGVGTGAQALRTLDAAAFDIVMADVALPDMSGEELTRRVEEVRPDTAVLAIAAYGSTESAGRMMRLGAYDFVEKPFSVGKLRHTIGRALEYSTLRRENRTLQAKLGQHVQTQALVGNSAAVQSIREKIKLVASTDATILIAGERGTGKEVVAREIHRLSDRAGEPFVKIDCASIPGALLERTLFGCEGGAFNGAAGGEPGAFELAKHGTVLLDEIGEVQHPIQAKLLRVIQEGELERVGGSEPVGVQARVLATTSRNLKDEIRKGRFREDLFYRLDVAPLELPPLRERRGDIPLLIDHFNRVLSRKNAKDPVRFTDDAVRKLCSAHWKGNVRQLHDVIERAVILRGGTTLDADYLQFENDREEQISRIEQAFRYGTVREMEKLMILARLKEHSDNRTRSAETLDISVRTLRNKLHEYNVPRKGEATVREEAPALRG
jgi:DNA-binding NtrC family response regulator